MKKSMCAKWFEIKLWKKLIILFPITFIIIFVTLFETTYNGSVVKTKI